MRVFCVLLILGAMAAGRPAGAQTTVDLELCLASDGSGSISPDEFVFQRQGFAAAIASQDVQDAIQSGYHKQIAIAYMEWGGATSMHPIVGWTLIDGPEAARDFAARLLAAPRVASGYNSISEAIAFCQNWMETNSYTASRMVIDVSGDAGQRGGRPLAAMRNAAINAGVTINAIALNFRGGGLSGPRGEPLIDHFRRDVIGGFGAFALAVGQAAEFVAALKRKLVLEIAARPDVLERAAFGRICRTTTPCAGVGSSG